MRLRNNKWIKMNKIISIAAIFFVFITLSSAQNGSLNVGDTAPEIRLPNLKGRSVTLSSFRCKIVLIDFWATWCPPCVKEQPKLAEIYKKYKNAKFKNGSGFEIFGVSLDNKKKAWENVIKKNNITWIQVSDLKFWLSPIAKLYNLQEIPANFLIDDKGIILAKDLHEKELEEQLNKMLISK